MSHSPAVKKQNRGNGSLTEDREIDLVKDTREINGVDPSITMKYLIRALLKYNASDLHLKVGRPPLYRINGKLVAANMPQMSIPQMEAIMKELLSERNYQDLERDMEIDFSFRIKDIGRFRCNVFYQRGTMSVIVRMIPLTVPSIQELGVSSVVRELCTRKRGLVLVTGATGSGKSTTMAAMVQYINENRHSHVLCLEDPIEFIYRDLKSSITQRELGTDTRSLSAALRAGLRQDPDVITIGELRDPETIQLALTAAETGHLVISTLHTRDARGTIERIIDVFPPHARDQVRNQVASALEGVVTQQLVLRADGKGRVPAQEIMINSPTIEKLITENRLDELESVIARSNEYYRMRTFNQDLERLYRSGTITRDEALKNSSRPDELKMLLSGIRADEGYDSQPSAEAGVVLERSSSQKKTEKAS